MADRHVLNPGGGVLDVPDVDAAIAAAREENLVLMVDVGGGMEIPLDELVDDIEPDLVDDGGPGTVGALVDRVAARRRELGMSQTDVAKRAGTTQSAIFDFETGEVEPRLPTLQRFAAAVGLRLKVELLTPEQDLADEPGPYRVDPDQPRNVYRGDVYVGVMFDPADAAAVARALNGAAPVGATTREVADG